MKEGRVLLDWEIVKEANIEHWHVYFSIGRMEWFVKEWNITKLPFLGSW